MIAEAYSWLALDLDLVGWTVAPSSWLLPARDLLDAALRIFVERDAELLDQVRRGPRLMNQGVYSAKCSELSVTK